MNNDLLEQKGWWAIHWKWFVPSILVILVSAGIFFSSDMVGITADFAQAYADQELYEDAIKKINANEKANNLLGPIEPIAKLTILEGEVRYSNSNKTVSSTIWIYGSKGRAKMDISAIKTSEKWQYTKINLRIKEPPEKRQTITLISQN